MIKIKVLIYTEAWGGGGIESFIMNVIRHSSGCDIEFDIYSTWDWNEQFDEELVGRGVRRYCVFNGTKPGQIKRLYCGNRALYKLIIERNYDAIWINTMNGAGFTYAWTAKKAGIPVRMVHSHNSDVGEDFKYLKRGLSDLGTKILAQFSTCNLACSSEAGAFLFGKRNYKIINNGIEIDKFKFSAMERNNIRKLLGIPADVTLAGNIGRISSQKNPLFQLRVFAEYKKINDKAKYIFVGKKDMEAEVRQTMRDLRLSDADVRISGPVDNPAPYYCALDAFLLPSLFEGLPIAELEAQCNGLPIVSNVTISHEADVTNLVEHCSLNDTPHTWAIKLDKQINKFKFVNRAEFAALINEAGYSAEDSAKQIVGIMRDEYNKSAHI